MADIEDAMRDRATTYGALNDRLAGRFYPAELPQKATMPACIYLRAGTVPFHTGGRGSPLRMVRMRIVVYGARYDSMADTAVLVTDAFHRWGGLHAGITVQQSFLENVLDFGRDPDTGQFMRALDFRVWYLADEALGAVLTSAGYWTFRPGARTGFFEDTGSGYLVLTQGAASGKVLVGANDYLQVVDA